jgi:capsular polysaccharide biosynthesis protein
MEYISTFKIQTPNTYICQRNPPNFLCNEEETTNSLKKIFGFTKKLFERHYIEYEQHKIEKFLVDTEGETIVDVRFKWNYNYFHFLTEGLPSLLETLKVLNNNASIACIQSKFIKDVLEWFDIKNKLYIGGRVKDVYTMRLIECGNPSPQKINLLRSRIYQKLSFEKTYGILIKRSESCRSILNHDELLEFLQKKYSLEWKVFDTLPFKETTELFSKVSVIVAPHGAGLTNMLFSPSNITIIEIMDKNDPNVCYWHLSEMLGNKHYILPIATTNGNFTVNNFDLISKFIQTQDEEQCA